MYKRKIHPKILTSEGPDKERKGFVGRENNEKNFFT
jgi:hypothetical protein